ncbi:ABC transporter permease [Paenibacillus montaniterrae]|uniref:ABC transporter permease n=1 Tax=Paenibacillus montaniterrae TaxID=429341 RepID=A0A920D0G0_9BACL|nr:ABC transporter permease [Paenibacillus montaniterrae]GIP19520.1 ABC transporter permease [Paenibacillus montaniterrae]
MLIALTGALESGLLYALMALGVYITYRVLDFPDLTVDGSFTTGAAIATVMTINGTAPILSLICAFIGGALAGLMTGLLHTKGKINGLLSGIIMMIALYSINLRIMGKPNLSLRGEANLFDGASVLLIGLIIAIGVKLLLDLFFKTNVGLSLRATGDNQRMIKSFGANTDVTTIIGVSLSNALVATSGGLIAFSTNQTNNNMGVGMIVIGLASVIIGEAIFGKKSIFRTTLAVVLGAIIYRLIYALALRVPGMDAQDMKLITAIIIVGALVIPTIRRAIHEKQVSRKRAAEVISQLESKGGVS